MKKLIPLFIFLFLGALFYFERTDLLFKYIPYLFGGLIGAIFLLISTLALYTAYTYARAFKVRASVRLEPRGDGSGGTIFLDIENLGDGDIAISGLGVLDRRIVKDGHFKSANETSKDIALHSAWERPPLRIEAGSSDSLSLAVDSKRIFGTFSGVFFDIDAVLSDQNKYAKRIAEGKVRDVDMPIGVVRKKVKDRRLHNLFLNR